MAVRWTYEEWEEVKLRAKKARLRPSTYLKARALTGRVRIAVEPGTELADIDTTKATSRNVVGH